MRQIGVGRRAATGGGSKRRASPSSPTSSAMSRRTPSRCSTVVQDRGATAPQVRPRPVPARERILQGLVARVDVQVGGTGPRDGGALESNFDMRARGDRPPAVASMLVQHERQARQPAGVDHDPPPQPGGHGHRHLVHVDHQVVAPPSKRARADGKTGRGANGPRPAALGERPVLAATVQHRVEGAVILRVATPPPPCARSAARRRCRRTRSARGLDQLQVLDEL